MRAWKLVVGVLITGVALTLFPYGFRRLGWIDSLGDQAWLVLLVTGFGLILKMYIADRATDGEFLFYKFGYDNCIVTFGAVLTAFALQLESTADLFPGLAAIPILNRLHLPAITALRNLQLFVLLLLALLASLATAHIAGEIKRQNGPDRGFWPFLSSVVGLGMLGTYVLVLITKG
jgi:hypothetical protein